MILLRTTACLQQVTDGRSLLPSSGAQSWGSCAVPCSAGALHLRQEQIPRYQCPGYGFLAFSTVLLLFGAVFSSRSSHRLRSSVRNTPLGSTGGHGVHSGSPVCGTEDRHWGGAGRQVQPPLQVPTDDSPHHAGRQHTFCSQPDVNPWQSMKKYSTLVFRHLQCSTLSDCQY